MTTNTNELSQTAQADYRKKYERDGYAIIENVLDEETLSEMRAHIRFLEQSDPNRKEVNDHNLVQHDAFWMKLATSPALLDIAEQFIGPNIALFASSYFTKQPFEGQKVLWHQDGAFWPLDPGEVLTLWLAVDDSTSANGCLRVIPGTQNSEYKEWTAYTDEPNVLEARIDPKDVEEEKAVDVELKAGSVSIHHPNVIHGSEANLSDTRRCGLTLRYIPTTTRITVQPWSCQFLLRGEAVDGINEYMEYPKYTEGSTIPFRGKEEWM